MGEESLFFVFLFTNKIKKQHGKNDRKQNSQKNVGSIEKIKFN